MPSAAKASPARRRRETAAERRARAEAALDGLRALHGPTVPFLDAETPLECLVAVMLSAQCTDAQVNRVTPALFARCRSAQDYATIPLRELEKLVHSTGFYRAKARSIQAMARALLERHGGEVPATMAELHALPGVGRKTANVVLNYAFGRCEGVCVDTHVGRLARRLGWSREDDPEKVEADLMKLLPPERWPHVAFLLISHGRAFCSARKPECGRCPVAGLCPKRGVAPPTASEKTRTTRNTRNSG